MAGPKGTREETQERRRWLAKNMPLTGLHAAFLEEFTQRFDVTPSTAYQDRKIILDQLAEAQGEGSIEELRRDFIDRCRRAGDEAARDGAFGPVATFLGMEAKAIGVYEPVRVEHSGPGGGPIPVALTTLPDEALASLAWDEE